MFSSVITGNLAPRAVAARLRCDGIQSIAVRRLGQISTTYLTSTLTGILTAPAIRRWPAAWQRAPESFYRRDRSGARRFRPQLFPTYSPPWIPAVVLIPVAAILAGSVALARHGEKR